MSELGSWSWTSFVCSRTRQVHYPVRKNTHVDDEEVIGFAHDQSDTRNSGDNEYSPSRKNPTWW